MVVKEFTEKKPKNFGSVSNINHNQGLNIISVGISPYARDKKKQLYFFRLDLCDTWEVAETIRKVGFNVLEAIA